MIYYSPVTGDPPPAAIDYAPRTCFLMTWLGHPTETFRTLRNQVEAQVRENGFRCMDAGSTVTGRDFLEKIWTLILRVPVGIALVDKSFSTSTVANIFYELGMMQAYGKETLVIKTPGTNVPSDFVRTEYVEFDQHFSQNLAKFFHHLRDLASHFAKMAHQFEKNPFLAIDYLRRAYLLTADEQFRQQANRIFNETQLGSRRAKNSVEFLFADFCLRAEGGTRHANPNKGIPFRSRS